MGYIVTLLITAFAFWCADQLIAGISFSSTLTLVIAAAVFGLVNAIIRPVAVALSLPLTIITLGLFILVVNAAMFALTAAVIPGMVVASFGAAFMGAIIVSVVSWATGRLVGA
ncbi:phage holin family protein [Plastoroseomonas arctica]|uniref:Phage holin family protein n=1 Tax=Plastoroseomonas arctica TaxID=1509237 RepID=A0AAF1KMB1_9PROT|nr:phage holin family protein [Plastoroseomonas arctica]MBR0656126.1 phage holin family protein [Plastoroseomonas arctica]